MNKNLQFILWGCLAIVVTAALAFWAGYYKEKELLDDIKQRLENNVNSRVESLINHIDQLSQDTLFLASLPPISGIVRATANQGYDEQGSSSLQTWKSRLESIFTSYMRNHQNINQIRLIGVARNGEELVRVERLNNEILARKPHELQTKGNRDYFQHAIQQAPGTTYISDINLNREFGQIQVPHTPTIRIATTIADQNGKVFGIVIINNSMNNLVELLKQNLPPEFLVYLTNPNQAFLLHPNNDKAFAFEFGQNHRLEQEFQSISDADDIRRNTTTSEIELFASRKFKFQKQIDTSPFQLSIGYPYQLIKRQVDQAQLTMLPNLGAILLIAIAFIYFYLKSNRLKHAQAHLTQITDATPSALITVSEEGIIESVNTMACEIFGYRKPEMQGQPIEILLPESNRKTHPLLRQSYVESPNFRKMSQRANLFARRKDGSQFQVDIGLNFLREDEGIKILVAVIDITERMAIKEENKQLLGILELTPDFVLTANLNGYLIYANQSARKALGLKNNRSLHNIHIRDLHPQNSGTKVVAQGIPEALKNDLWSSENTLRTQSSGDIPVSQIILCHRNPHGEPTFISSTMRDMSEVKERERELASAQFSAEQANKAKSAFVANMSHEIRTPLNAVLGLMHLMHRTSLSTQQNDYVLKAEYAAKSLLAILNDILDYSKIEAGKMLLDQHPFVLDECMRNIGVILAANLNDKPIELIFDIHDNVPQHIIGDSLRLQQVLINIAGNAIKFSQKGHVIIRISLKEKNHNLAVINFEIEDTGIGISPEDWKNIFSGFSQAESSTTRKHGGTGLGLAISSRLIKFMGGTLAGGSELGKGTTFTFSIPFECDLDTSEKKNNDMALLKDKHVLLLEDHPISQKTTRRLLENFGWHVTLVTTCEEASETIQRAPTPFNLVYLSWSLIKNNENNLIQQLKSNDVDLKENKNLHKPVVILMIQKLKENATLAIAQSKREIDNLIEKPFTGSMLFDAAVNVYYDRGLLEKDAESITHLNLNLAGLKILLVEDNAVNQQVAEEMLIAEGATVNVLIDGEKAVEHLSEYAEQYDVVLMDIQMPIMDGYTATRIIREKLKLNDIPIIAMTANAMLEDKRKAIEYGMNDHIAKPFDIDTLVKKLAPYTAGGKAKLKKAKKTFSENFKQAANKADININDAEKRFNGNQRIYLSALSAFPKELDKLIEAIEVAKDNNEIKPLMRTLHSIKGTSSTIGLNTLTKAVEQLESQLKETKNLELFSSPLLLLSEQAKKVNKKISTLICSINRDSNQTKSGLKSVKSDELAILIEYLKESSMKSVSIVEKWQSESFDLIEYQDLVEAVVALNFERAITLAESALVLGKSE